MKRRVLGLTVIEVLVILAMIGVLLALIVPAVQSARDAARKSVNGKPAVNHQVVASDRWSSYHTYRIAEIEGCEYIIIDEGGNGQAMSHKGNCKFCDKRNR